MKAKTARDDEIHVAIDWLEGVNPDAEDHEACKRVALMLREQLTRRAKKRQKRRVLIPAVGCERLRSF